MIATVNGTTLERNSTSEHCTKYKWKRPVPSDMPVDFSGALEWSQTYGAILSMFTQK